MSYNKDGYSAALILSEGRYERRERWVALRETERELVLEPMVKSLWIRTSNPSVVKRIQKNREERKTSENRRS